MYYVFLATIVLTIFRIVMLGRCRKVKQRKAGKVAMQNNIIELSRKGKK